jgi:hypothetical protein
MAPEVSWVSSLVPTSTRKPFKFIIFNINIFTHVNCAWEDLALGQHSEAISELGYVVLWSLINSFNWFVTLKISYF